MMSSRVAQFWSELKRRRVTRVAVAYALVGWVLIEVADTVFPNLSLPGWTVTLVIVLVAIGLPVALALAWAYDIEPTGVQRTPALAADEWQRVQAVLGAALELPAAQRAAFIERESAASPALRQELDSLLAAHDRPGALDRAPLLVRAATSAAESAPSVGRRAPHYEILEKVGGGGMGVVYRARDRRLERTVALKFLPPHMTADEHAKQRFLVEAQTAAALDHANICTIYEVGETDDGHLFIAMPFYEGETLRRRLEQGPLPLAQALDIAAQVAHGLARAHDRGIVHRDIKPANLVITAEGVVKIVDFGVAKLADVSVTGPGVALGTVAYMSPEQAEGDDVDGRTDLWSLGVVLYEMLTGERPFRGATDSVVLNAILTAEPARIAALRAELEPQVEDVLLRALSKKRADRYGSAREFATALDELRGVNPAAPSASVVTDVHRAGPRAVDHTPSGGVLAQGERRRATVVVSAIGNYDTLLEQLAPDALEHALAKLRTEAEAVAAAHGGVLNESGGEQIVMLFGIPVTQEDDAVRAARAALELHARLIRPHAALPLTLGTGIESGTVIAHALAGGDRPFRVAGSAVQLATRLAQQAAAGEVWLSEESRGLLEPYFETEEREPVRLRDRSQPIVPYRVVAESGLRTRIEAGERTGLTAFTGRDTELGALRAALDASLAGDGQIVTITGEPGLGKSRLLHEFRHGAAEPHVPVRLGRCQSYGGGVAYLPFIEILRAVLGIGLEDDVERVAERIRAVHPTLDEFVPLYLHLLSIRSTAHPVPKHLQGDAFRLAIQEALAALVTLSAQATPCVILLEDWHWADDASQAVLRQIGEVLAGCPLLVLVTSRPGYGVDLGAPGQFTHMPLRPLESASTGTMLRALLGVERVPAELVTLIHERTAGNPFFIEEISHALIEEGAVRVDGEDATLTGPLTLLELPDSIQGVIRARLDRLDRNVRDVLRLAAVVGREFPRPILERALPDRTDLPQSLELLKGASLIQQTQVAPDAVYRFKHVLTQEVAYASLLEHQRRELHGRVGAIIEALPGGQTDDQLERLAHHFSRAEAWEKAVHYGMRSAESASRLAQFAEALQALERTQRWVARLPAGEQRTATLVSVLLQEERLCETLGQRARQQQLIDQLIELLAESDDRPQLAEVYLRQGDLFTLLRRYPEAEDALQRALALRRELGDRVGERNTLRSLGLLRWHEGRNHEALEVAEEAVRIDRERGDLPGLVGDLTNCGAILRALGEHERARTTLEEALAVAEQHGGAADPEIADELALKRVYALHHLANSHRERGDRATALEYLHRAGRIAEEKRLPIQLAYHYTSVAHLHLLEGEIEESLRHYRDAIELCRRARYALGLAQTLRIHGEVLVGLGRDQEAVTALQEAAAVFAELRDVEGEGRMWSAVAGAEERLGHAATALAAWGKAAQLLRQVEDGAGELLAVEGLARTTRQHVDEPSLALAHYDRGVELAATLGDHAAEGRIRNVMGILEYGRGGYPQALAHYERALQLFQQMPDEVHAGLMLNSMAATLRALGRDGDAETRLREALDVHARTGQRQLEGHALALYADIRAQRDDADGAAQLYTRSLELRRALGDRRGEGWMLHGLARCELARGEPYRVREHLTTAAAIAAQCGDGELASACEQLRRVAD